MILYFADRKMNIVGTAFTNKGDGYICYNDKETSEVDTGTVIFTANVAYPAGKREEAMQIMKSGNYLFVADNDGNANFYTIVEMESSTLDRSIYIYAEDIGLDLLNNVCDELEITSETKLEDYLIQFIYGTDLEKGDWDDPFWEELNDNPALALSFNEQTAKERLQRICEAFDVEPFITFKIERMSVTHKYLNVKQKRGVNNHVHLVIGREVSDIRVKQSVADLATALKPKGSKPEGNIGIKSYTEPLSSGGFRQYYMWLKFVSYDADGYPVVGEGTSGAHFILNSRLDEYDPVESEDVSEYSVNRFNHKGIYIVKPQTNNAQGYLEPKERSGDPDRFTWIRFSPNENGSPMTQDFSYGNSKWIGIATGKDTATQTSDPQDYRWTDISYATSDYQLIIISGNGAGVLTEGNNVTSNVWIKYSPNANGSSMTNTVESTTKYVGLCYGRGTTESSTASDYEWLPLEQATSNSMFVEVSGGVNRGIPYTNRNGETKYIHYRFAGDENGNDISYDINGSYIGISINNTYPTPMSITPSRYTWSPVDGVKIDAIDLVGYEYTEVDEEGNDDIYIEEGVVKSYKAIKEWGRFVTSNTASAHIVRSFTYETTDRHVLLEETVKQLKKVREPSVTYEVSLIRMPDGLSLGDTVYVTDPEGALYLEARLLKLEKEYCNKQITATFGDYKVIENDLADELQKLKEKVEEELANLTTYTWIVYADDSSGTGMSVNSEGKRWMGIATNKLTKTPDLTNPFLYSWSKISVREESYTIYYYGVSASANTVPSTWTQDNIEPDVDNPYMWAKGTRYFNDGSNEMVPPHIIGVFGVGIASITTYYARSTTTTAPSGEGPSATWSTTPPVITEDYPYLWSYEVIEYTNGDTDTKPKKIVGKYGKDGTTIISDVTEYGTSTVSASEPSSWSTTIPTLTPTNKYLWMRETITYSDGTTKNIPAHIIGVYGDTGAQGPQGNPGQNGQDGKYVMDQYPEYYLSTSSTSVTGGSWSARPEAYKRNKYYWVRTVTIYSDDPNTPITSEPVLDMALTASNQNALNTQTTADGKGTIFYQTTEPSTDGRNTNDIWFDTDDGNAMYRFDGSEWIKVQFSDGAISSLSADKLTAGTIDASSITVSNINGGNIVAGTLSANQIRTGILTGSGNSNFNIDLDRGELYISGFTETFSFTDSGLILKGDGGTDFVSKFSEQSLDFYTGVTNITSGGTVTGTKQAWIDAVDGLGVPGISIGDASTRNRRWYISTMDDGAILNFSRIVS